MTFNAKQVTKTYTQRNAGTPDQVFPLLCPVREADWLDGWQYETIYSKSGLVEENCVFAAPHHGEQRTIWHVTKHDPQHFVVEFVRMTPEENTVRITIKPEGNDDGTTAAHIAYRYTALCEAQNDFIANELDANFQADMQWWERALNHYLTTGEMLKRD